MRHAHFTIDKILIFTVYYIQNEIPNSDGQSLCQVSLSFKLNSTLNYLIIHATHVCFFSLFAAS